MRRASSHREAKHAVSLLLGFLTINDAEDAALQPGLQRNLGVKVVMLWDFLTVNLQLLMGTIKPAADGS